MPNPLKKAKRNAPGKYYVDRTLCTMCQVCVSMGEGYFDIDWDEETAYVTSQPDGRFGEMAVREAMLSCPENAIGDDGEDVEKIRREFNE